MARRPTILSLGDLGLDDVREAADLREIVGAHAAIDLERISDLARIMGRARRGAGKRCPPAQTMTDLVQQQVKTVRDAHAAHDCRRR